MWKQTVRNMIILGAVVLVAIGVVALILQPIFFPDHAKSRQASCLSNMSQLGKAFMMYLDDNNSRYPAGGCIESLSAGKGPKGDWVWFEGSRSERGAYTRDNPKVPTWRMRPDIGSIWRYTNKNIKLFICPSDPHASDEDATTLGPFHLSYTANASLVGCDTNWQLRPALDNEVKHLSKTVLLSDSYTWRGTLMRGGELPPCDGVFRWMHCEPVTRHGGGGNFVFCDGHVKWVNPRRQRDVVYRLDGKQDQDQFSCPKWQDVR